jgi:hypothetical protein
VGADIGGPSLRRFNIRAIGWVTGRFSLLGQNQLKLFRFSFLFSIFWESGIISKMAQS